MGNIIETVKLAKVCAFPPAGGDHYYEIPIRPGEDQVALLLACQLGAHPDTLGANQITYEWIWRKSMPEVDAVKFANDSVTWQEDSDVIDHASWFNEWDTAAGYAPRGGERYVVYAYPVVVIRPPQFVVWTFSGDTRVTCLCWYMLQDVSDAELARLMVKDHA